MSEIILKIKGKGNQKIIFGGSLSCYYVYNLINDLNNITLQYNHLLSSCNSMFYSLNNITKAELSKFDISKLTDMGCMFESSSSLEFINLQNQNFKTSSVSNLAYFEGFCNSL